MNCPLWVSSAPSGVTMIKTGTIIMMVILSYSLAMSPFSNVGKLTFRGGNCSFTMKDETKPQEIPNGSSLSLEHPCIKMFCNGTASVLNVWGCPPPDNSTDEDDTNPYWPRCCSNNTSKNN
uniref:8.9 kDa family member n=1 Tax=Rhipicephalus appendiculatus TaxID=34631 RepID=A0A131Z4T2_RHIAP